MIRNIQRTWFEVWGNETAQNRLLKGLLAFLAFILAVETVGLVQLALRKPTLVAVSPTETRILTVTPPKKELLETEITRAVQGYVNAHYNWEYSKIDEAFSAAAKYVDPGFVKSFLSANQEQAKLAKDKKLSQRFFIATTSIDSKAKKVRVDAERIILVDNLRAASPITVDVQFDFGDRTETNPEGIYVVGETLAPKSGGAQ